MLGKLDFKTGRMTCIDVKLEFDDTKSRIDTVKQTGIGLVEAQAPWVERPNLLSLTSGAWAATAVGI